MTNSVNDIEVFFAAAREKGMWGDNDEPKDLSHRMMTVEEGADLVEKYWGMCAREKWLAGLKRYPRKTAVANPSSDPEKDFVAGVSRRRTVNGA